MSSAGGFPLLFQEAPFQIGTRGIVGVLAITTLALAATLASNKALVYLSSPRVGLISMSELVLGAVFGYFLFNEQLTWRTLIGAVLVVGSGFRLSMKPMQESPEPADRVTP